MTVTQQVQTEGATIMEEALEGFRSRMRGPVLVPGHAGYDDARRVWNGMIDRRPAVIARCTGNADVVAAVTFGREQGLLVAVRGGGHNVAGTAVCDGGLMIDLSLMRGVHVDPQTRIVRVQGGAVWGDVDRETQLFGLAVPNGFVSSTGVAGLTLGGGYGALRRKYGLACDNLVSVDIVGADGQLRTASQTENADLFWAVRGGGGNFGVVTSFAFRAHPIGNTLFVAAPLYPLAQAEGVIRSWRDLVVSAPDSFSSNIVILTVPDLPLFPEAACGQAVVGITGVWCGDLAAGEAYTQPLRALGEPLVDLSGSWPYLALQSANDAFFPPHVDRHYWKSIDMPELADASIEQFAAHAATRSTSQSALEIWHHGGAVARVAPEATAFWRRRVPFMISFNATWTEPADQGRCIAWARAGWDAMRPFSDGGVYVNFPGLGEEGEAMVHSAYGGNYERLVAIKRQYDPGNLFQMNLNIRPATAK
jgi:FAD/FMN-containing dehydrogenase